MGIQPHAVSSPDFVARVSFPVTCSVLGIIALGLATSIYAYATASLKDTLVFFSVGAAAVGQVTASFYTAKMLGAALTSRRDDLEYRRKQTSMQFGTRWNDASMHLARDVFREVIDHAGTHDELVSLIQSKQTHVIHVLNFLEEIATTSKNGLGDPNLPRTQFSGVVAAAWTKTFPWVQIHRQRRSLPTLWEDLESLYVDWKQ